MKKWLKRLGVLVAILLVAAAGFLVPTLFGTPWKADHFYLRVLMQALLDDPLVLTQLKILESVGLDFHADDLPDQTLALRQKQVDRVLADRETLESYDPDLSHEVMSWLLSDGIGGDPQRFMKHPYAIEQLQGLHVRFPDVMVNYHLIGAPSDADNYIARVEKIGGALDDLLETATTLESEGFTVPRFILEKVAKTAREFYAKPPEENALYVDFTKTVDTLEDASDDTKAALRARFEAALNEQAIPGYERFADGVAAMAARAPTDAGVWHLPDGEAYYAAAIRQNTSTDKTADEIHQLGLDEVNRIQAEMEAIMEQVGAETSTATFGQRMRDLAADDRWYFEDSEAGRKALIARYAEIAAEIEGGLDTMFQTNPKAPLDVDPVPEFKQDTAPFAYYFPAAFDGSKPGTFFANVRDVKEHKKFAMRTLVYHEAIPGHHFQLSIARAQKHLPMFRQLIPLTAYSEGWALYAEQLAAEHGFQDDPYDRLGYLDAQLFRAVRLVVDTGLHAKRWDRERAIQYMVDNNGGERSEAETEIDRYCVMPGQALGYMVGRLEILRLREKAMAALGEHFDLKAFHDAVLLPGALPLALLEREVDRYVAAAK